MNCSTDLLQLANEAMRYGKKPEFSTRTSEQKINLFLYVYLMDHSSKANKIEMIITDDA